MTDSNVEKVLQDVIKKGLSFASNAEKKGASEMLTQIARLSGEAAKSVDRQGASKGKGVSWSEVEDALNGKGGSGASGSNASSSSIWIVILTLIISLLLALRPEITAHMQQRAALANSLYPNRASKTGYLFLDPPRVLNTQRRVEFQIGKVLKRMGWKIREGTAGQKKAAVVWVKSIDEIDWDSFDPSYQVANRIHNESTMTTKGNLIENLKRHWLEQKAAGTAVEAFSPSNMHPETYLLYREADCNEFFSKKRPGIWISKETHNSRGRGIEIVPDAEKTLRPKYTDKSGKCILDGSNGGPSALDYKDGGMIVQKYILNPLLLNNRKCETRAYWLLASVDPWIIFYHEGTVRLNSEEYSPDDFDNPRKHITNVYQQRDHPEFNTAKFKDSLKWNYQMLDKYLTQEKLAPQDWVKQTLVPTLKDYLRAVFQASRPTLEQVPGTFALLGADFIIDSNLHVYLTEIQQYPGMSATGIKKEIIPAMLREAVDIVLEVSHRKNYGQSLKNLDTPKRFEPIVNEATY